MFWALLAPGQPASLQSMPFVYGTAASDRHEDMFFSLTAVEVSSSAPPGAFADTFQTRSTRASFAIYVRPSGTASVLLGGGAAGAGLSPPLVIRLADAWSARLNATSSAGGWLVLGYYPQLAPAQSVEALSATLAGPAGLRSDCSVETEPLDEALSASQVFDSTGYAAASVYAGAWASYYLNITCSVTSPGTSALTQGVSLPSLTFTIAYNVTDARTGAPLSDAQNPPAAVFSTSFYAPGASEEYDVPPLRVSLGTLPSLAPGAGLSAAVAAAEYAMLDPSAELAPGTPVVLKVQLQRAADQARAGGVTFQASTQTCVLLLPS